MPPHSSHILQPLDVSCFSSLKAQYGRQIENLIRCRIHHVTKLEFLPAFRNVYRSALSEQNIRSGFRATGLIPFDPDVVLSDLHAMTKTPTPPPPEISQNSTIWTLKIL